jgi:hypothetical protein
MSRVQSSCALRGIVVWAVLLSALFTSRPAGATPVTVTISAQLEFIDYEWLPNYSTICPPTCYGYPTSVVAAYASQGFYYAAPISITLRYDDSYARLGPYGDIDPRGLGGSLTVGQRVYDFTSIGMGGPAGFLMLGASLPSSFPFPNAPYAPGLPSLTLYLTSNSISGTSMAGIDWVDVTTNPSRPWLDGQLFGVPTYPYIHFTGATVSVPEPSSLLSLSGTFLAFGLVRRRRSRRAAP